MPTVYRRRNRDGALAEVYSADIWINGTKFCRSTSETSRRAAERSATEIEGKLRSQLARDNPETLTLDTLMGRYWQDHASELASASDTKYFIRQILKALDRHTPLEKFGNSHLAEYVLIRRRNGVSPATINREIDVIRSAYLMARDRWEHPVRSIRWKDHRQVVDTQRTITISLEEAVRAIDLLAHRWPDTADCLEMAIYTGARLNELESLIWERTNLETGEAVVLAKRKARQGYRERTIYLNSSAIALLSRREGPRTGPVFTLTNRRKAWEWVRAQIGRPELRWHDLRHTHATMLRRGNVALEIVKKSLGHTHMSTTLRYAHVGQDETHLAVEGLPMLRQHGNVVPLTRKKG